MHCTWSENTDSKEDKGFDISELDAIQRPTERQEGTDQRGICKLLHPVNGAMNAKGAV